MSSFKIKERHIIRIYNNPKITSWFDQLAAQRDKDVAGMTIDYLKREFPEIRDVLNGELIYEEDSDGNN